MSAAIRAFLADERGATAIEYALLGTLVAVAIAGTFAVLGNGLEGLFNSGTTDVLQNQTAILTGN